MVGGGRKQALVIFISLLISMMIIFGIVAFISPKTAWYLQEGWSYKKRRTFRRCSAQLSDVRCRFDHHRDSARYLVCRYGARAVEIAAGDGPARSVQAVAAMEPTLKDLKDPEFMEYLIAAFPDGKILPDDRDFGHEFDLQTEAECIEEYQLAQARRVMRLWQEWKVRRK
jgi:hypothetical protein